MHPLTKRKQAKELLDTGEYSIEEYRRCLKYLGRIGRWLGGDKATLKAIEGEPRSILDVGCGGGDLCHALSKAYPNAKVVGIDIDSQAIAYAKEHHPRLEFHEARHTDIEPKSVDLVTSTLVMHHLSDEEIVAFLQESQALAVKQVVINDLHRSRLAYLAFLTIAPFLFPNRLILHDGLLSVQRAFTRSDWEALLGAADVDKYHLQWNRGFRWTLAINV